MRYRLSDMFVVAVLFAAFANVANAADKLKEDVLASQEARFQAMIEADLVELDELLADDLHYSHSNGNVETKAQFLSTIESKKVDYLSAKRRDVDVRLFDDMAVVTGLAEIDLVFRGERMAFTMRFLEVARKVGTTWQLLAWQSVMLPDD